MRINLAILFTWRAVAKLRNSINTNLLIMDEVFDSSMDASGVEEFMKILNNLYVEGARSVPGVTYVSTWSLFANSAGVYRPNAYVNGNYVGLRHPDGIHFSSPGQAVLGTFVARQLGSIYHVPIFPHAPAMITGW